MKKELRRRLVAVFMLLIVLTSAGTPGHTAGAQAAGETYNVVLLVDESGSMWNRTDSEKRSLGPEPDKIPTTDPLTGLPVYDVVAGRIQATQGLLAAMAGEPTNARFNVAVVTFGSAATVASATSYMRDPGALRMKSEAFLRSHVNYEGRFEATNTLAALQAADMLLFDGDAPRRPGRNVVLLITDGVPELTENAGPVQPLDEHLDQVREFTARLTAPVGDTQVRKATLISLLLNINPSKDYVTVEHRKFWQEIAAQSGGTSCNYWEVNDRALLFHRTQAILNCLLNAPPPGDEQTATPLVPRSFGVEDFVREMAIIIVKNKPDTQVVVSLPGGSRLAAGNNAGVEVHHEHSAASESYAIRRTAGATGTWAGCWSVSVSADDPRAEVRFVVNSYSEEYRLQFVRPLASSLWPVAKPLPVELALLNDADQVTNPGDLNLNRATRVGIDGPAGVSTLDLQLQGSTFRGHYSGPAAGVYTFTSTLGGDQLRPLTSATTNCRDHVAGVTGAPGLGASATVAMRELPWVNLVKPVEGSSVPGDALVVESFVMLGGSPITADLPGRLEASLRSKVSGRAQPFALGAPTIAGNPYTGRPVGVVQTGAYTLTVSYIGRAPQLDTVITDTAQISLQIEQRPTPEPSPTGTTAVPGSAIIITPTPVIAQPITAAPVQTSTLPAVSATNTTLPPALTFSPTASPTSPTIVEGDSSGIPWEPLAGIVVLIGAAAAAFMAARWYSRRPRLNGIRLTALDGTAIPLRGSRRDITLGDAQLRFTPAAAPGHADMRIVNVSSPIMVDGSPYAVGDIPSVSNGTQIAIGEEVYTVEDGGSAGSATPDDYSAGAVDSTP